MKTLITLALLALSFSAFAQKAMSAEEVQANLANIAARDAARIEANQARIRAETEAVQAQADAQDAYMHSEEYLREQCKSEGNRVFMAAFTFGPYWQYTTDANPYPVCKEYREVKKARKAAERAARHAN